MSQDSVHPFKSGDVNAKVVTQAESALTYSTSITPDASLGQRQVITVSDTVAFAINAPTNPQTGQRLLITIKNASGGAVGTITWNAVFKKATWTSPADTKNRSTEFWYDGSAWVQLWQTAADVPN